MLRRLGIILIGLTITTVTGLSRSRTRMDEPLFGISYDPQLVRFDQTPQRIGELCPDLHNKKTWVFAHFRTKDAEYLIVSGYTYVRPNGPGLGGLSPDIVGTAVKIRGTSCTEETSDGFLWGKEAIGGWDVPQSVLNGILSDAFRRYSAAFGGKMDFLERIKNVDREALPPALQRELKVFEEQGKTR